MKLVTESIFGVFLKTYLQMYIAITKKKTQYHTMMDKSHLEKVVMNG